MTKLPGNLARTLRPSRISGGNKRMNTWQSVRAEVLERIRSREWAPGELIPTEEQLSQELGCARATVNRALRELADSGIIERRRKVGTRVASTAARKATLEMPAIRDEIEALGATYGYTLTVFEERMPSEQAMRALQVDADHKLILIQARYLADGEPHCCKSLWLNPQSLPVPKRSMLESLPPHEWLASQVPLTHSRYAILAEGASGLCATYLGVEEGTPVLGVERTNWVDATPVSFARQFYRPQHRLVSEE